MCKSAVVLEVLICHLENADHQHYNNIWVSILYNIGMTITGSNRNWNLMSVFSYITLFSLSLSSKLQGMSCFSQFSRFRGFVDTACKTDGFTVSY